MYKLITKKPESRITGANENAMRKSFFVYMALVFLLTFGLPNDILDISPALSWLVNAVAQFVPSVEKMGQRSSTPQIAQLILVFELCAMPILAYISICQTPLEGSIIRSRKHPIRFFVLLPFLIVLFTWTIIFFFPGYADGHGRAFRIAEAMLTTRTGLAFWSSVLFGGLGFITINLAYIFVKVFPHVLRK